MEVILVSAYMYTRKIMDRSLIDGKKTKQTDKSPDPVFLFYGFMHAHVFSPWTGLWLIESVLTEILLCGSRAR